MYKNDFYMSNSVTVGTVSERLVAREIELAKNS